MSDGLPLTSMAHPISEELIEKVCREFCRVERMEPDELRVGTRTQDLVWKMYRPLAVAAIEAVYDHQAALDERRLNPDSIVTAEIDIHQ